MKKLIFFSFILVCIFVCINSCKKDKQTQWDTEMLVPIATTNLSLQNLVKDTSVIKTNPDNSLTLALNKTLYELNLANLVVNIPDTSIGQKFGLDSLRLPNQIIEQHLSLGFLATNMLQSPDQSIRLLGQLLLIQNGNTMAIPPVTGFSSSLYQFDGSQFFQTATLSHGDVTVAVDNYLPVPISDVIIEVRNTNSGALVIADTIPYVGANDSTWQVIDISGKTIDGNLSVRLVNLSSPGSNGVPVLIDTSNYAKLWISVANLRASDAVAVFPSQDLVRVTEEVTQQIGDRKLTYLDAKQGQIHVLISSSVQQQLRLTYILEGAYDKNGRPLTLYTVVPAARPNQPSIIDSVLDISGYSINLTGIDGTKFNTYTQTVIAHADSTGQLAHISLADSLNIRYTIQNVAPNYIKGYAGRDTILAIDSANFDFLNMFRSGTIDLDQVNMNFNVVNGIGIDGQVKINSLTAVSTSNGTKSLTGSIIGQPLTINRATDFPLTPANNSFAFNSSNSNIKDLLGILPNKLNYNVEVKTNLAGNTQQYRDFVYLSSSMKINLDAEVPLSIIANHLVLKDTFSFDLSATNTNVAGITDGIINLIAQNKYPISAVLTMIAYDENWAAVDTVLINSTVAGADLDATCTAQNPKKTKIPIYINEDRMVNIKRAKYAVITADFSTVSSNPTCNNQHLKIYSDYFLGITFTARFNYKVKAKF